MPQPASQQNPLPSFVHLARLLSALLQQTKEEKSQTSAGDEISGGCSSNSRALDCIAHLPRPSHGPPTTGAVGSACTRHRSYGSRCRRHFLRSIPELILALLILPCHAPAADEPYRFCVTGPNAVGLSTMSRTQSPPSKYSIPTSASSLQAGRTPSTPTGPLQTHITARLLTHRPMPQEGYGSMMASCLARSTTRPPHAPASR